MVITKSYKRRKSVTNKAGCELAQKLIKMFYQRKQERGFRIKVWKRNNHSALQKTEFDAAVYCPPAESFCFFFFFLNTSSPGREECSENLKLAKAILG